MCNDKHTNTCVHARLRRVTSKRQQLTSQLSRAEPSESCETGQQIYSISLHEPHTHVRHAPRNTETHTPNTSPVPQMRSCHIFNTLTQIYIPSHFPQSLFILPHPPSGRPSQSRSPPPAPPLALSVISLAAACVLGRHRQLDKTAKYESPVAQPSNIHSLPRASATTSAPSGASVPRDGSIDTAPSARLTSGELWSYCSWAIGPRTFCLANDRCHIV